LSRVELCNNNDEKEKRHKNPLSSGVDIEELNSVATTMKKIERHKDPLRKEC
jgi:hypothetical protein